MEDTMTDIRTHSLAIDMRGNFDRAWRLIAAKGTSGPDLKELNEACFRISYKLSGVVTVDEAVLEFSGIWSGFLDEVDAGAGDSSKLTACWMAMDVSGNPAEVHALALVPPQRRSTFEAHAYGLAAKKLNLSVVGFTDGPVAHEFNRWIDLAKSILTSWVAEESEPQVRYISRQSQKESVVARSHLDVGKSVPSG